MNILTSNLNFMWVVFIFNIFNWCSVGANGICQEAANILFKTAEQSIQSSVTEVSKTVAETASLGSWIPSVGSVVKIAAKVGATMYFGPFGGLAIDGVSAVVDVATGNYVSAVVTVVMSPLNFVSFGISNEAIDAAQASGKKAAVETTKKIVQENIKNMEKKVGEDVAKLISKKAGEALAKELAKDGLNLATRQAIQEGLEDSIQTVGVKVLTEYIIDGGEGVTSYGIDAICRKIMEKAMENVAQKEILKSATMKAAQKAIEKSLDEELKQVAFEQLRFYVASRFLSKSVSLAAEKAGRILLQNAFKDPETHKSLLEWFLKTCL